MAYETSLRQNQPEQSLVADGVRIVDRIREVHHRLMNLGNVLHGPQPREIGQPSNGAASEPEPTVRRNLDRVSSVISDLEAELTFIETRL